MKTLRKEAIQVINRATTTETIKNSITQTHFKKDTIKIMMITIIKESKNIDRISICLIYNKNCKKKMK